jgi:ATP-binding cassette, subfamily G (WHITE), member 2, PDR
MLVVLGRPGSGCSTLLKTISGETDGFFVDSQSHVNYQGISMKQMHNDWRGECIYQAEVDIHFPQLTVGQTLEFAAQARGMIVPTFPHITRDSLYYSARYNGSPLWRDPSQCSNFHCQRSVHWHAVAPRNRIPGVTREQYAKHMRDVIMAVFGLGHTLNTKVGNDFVRGISGGERKRVSIAEA